MSSSTAHKFPIPRIPTTNATKTAKKRGKTLVERTTTKREAERARNKTRVNIGVAYVRWRELRDLRNLKTDAEMATFLIDSYQKWCALISNIPEGAISVCVKSERTEDLIAGSEVSVATNMSREEGCTGITFDISEISFAADEDSDCSNHDARRAEEEEEDGETEEGEEVTEDSDQEWAKDTLSGSDLDLTDSDPSDRSERDDTYVIKCQSEVRKCPKARELCTDCGAFFRLGKTHTCEYKVKPVLCNVCGKRLKDEAALKSHSRVHNEDYRHFCKFCMEPFKTRNDKLTHQASHNLNKKPYSCPDCAMKFWKLRARNFHLKEHRGPNSVSCPHCALVFPAAHCLKRHMLVHTGERQFVCEFCSRSFNQHGHLKSHLRLHTGEKPYQCQRCDKSFNHNVSLKSHVARYHSGAAVDSPAPRERSAGEEEEEEKTAAAAAAVPKTEETAEEVSATAEGCVDRDPSPGEEPRKRAKKTYHRSTGRPKGRPRRKATAEGLSPAAPEPSEEGRPASLRDVDSDWSDRNPTSELTDEDEAGVVCGAGKRRAGRRPNASKRTERCDSDSDFDPTTTAKKRLKTLQKPGNVGGRKARPGDSLVV